MQFLFKQRNGRKRKTLLEKLGLNDKIESIDKFNEIYVIRDKLANGGQGSIFLLEKKQNDNNDNKLDDDIDIDVDADIDLVVKKIYLASHWNIPAEIRKYYKQYVITSTNNLLNNFGIYYDSVLCELLIVTEKLKLNLIELKNNNNLLTESSIKLIMCDILNGLYILHNNGGYIHCDLNPTNIMCDYNNKWKLIDFDMMTLNNSYDLWKGTCGWVPKEMNPNVDTVQYKQTLDIWSFGLILVYILNDFVNPFDITNNEIKKYNLNDEYSKLLYYYKNKLTLNEYNKLRKLLIKWYSNKKISYQLYDLLLNNLLVFDHAKRIQTSKQIVNHPWFYDHIKANMDKYTFQIELIDVY